MINVLQQMLAFISDPNNSFGQHTADFLVVCGLSIFWAIVVALPLGILVAQHPLLSVVAANISGLGRAIPTIAFLAVALPYLGTGIKPAVVALAVIGIPPILLNTIAGLRGIDAATLDAARGMGMTRWQVLVRIEIPLVLPVVAAGVRTAAVQIVATAPLGALIAAGGYGDYIIAGVNLLDLPQALAGAIPVALLALVAEFGLAGAQRALTPVGMRRPATALVGLAESSRASATDQAAAA